MHRSRAGIERHVLAEDDRDPALLERMQQLEPLERAALAARQHLCLAHAEALHARSEQFLGDDEAARSPGGAGLGQRVGELGAQRHRLVRRQRPGRGGPDDHIDRGRAQGGGVDLHARRQVLVVGHAEAHVNRRRGLLLVLHFRLGERRAAVQAPVHRLYALVEVPVLDDAAEGAQLLRLVAGGHGQVRPLPVPQDPQALEVGALQVDLLLRVGAAGRAERLRVELLARAAVLLLHLQLDGQPVAVPAGDVGRVKAVQRAGFDDDVLQDLVDRMADVDRSVRVRRTVVQHEPRPPARHLAQFRVGAALVPGAHRGRLALAQVRLHRELGLRQVDRVFVVGHVHSS